MWTHSTRYQISSIWAPNHFVSLLEHKQSDKKTVEKSPLILNSESIDSKKNGRSKSQKTNSSQSKTPIEKSELKQNESPSGTKESKKRKHSNLENCESPRKNFKCSEEEKENDEDENSRSDVEPKHIESHIHDTSLS
jgi:hypothetical protein